MRRITFFSTLAVLLLLVPAASAQSSGMASAALDTNYTLSWWTVDGGGTTFAKGGGYTMGSTVGQPDAGILEGNTYTLVGGFWDGAVARIRVYLALVMRGFQGGNWEIEPNDTSAQAGVSLDSNEIYYGTMPVGDTNDYFYFDLSTSGNVELWLTNIPGGCDYDLVLRDAALTQVGYSGNVGGADEHITTGTLSPGRYYIQVYHRSTAGSSEPYNLRAVYP
jgi:hypothetical protein